jgi:phage gpG-like protein
MANKFNFGGIDGKANRAMKETIVIIANEAKNHYIRSFRRGGFTDETLVKWQARKSKKDNNGRAILVKTGDLKRSIIDRVNLSALKVVFSSDLPYAAIHNYGGVIHKKESSKTIGLREHSMNIKTMAYSYRFASSKKGTKKIHRATSTMNVTVGAHDIKMPQRQFIGKSEQVDKMAIKTIEKKIDSLFK